ncbi:MAG: hypothetical protein GXO30_08895 [Epsilonproteobacteria bacterium]|nr:hypothetical protein [Campylobacterota bacterium]
MTLADLPVLPKLDIPPLPFEVPLLMHPVAVHFVIAIPVLVIVLEIFNLVFKRRVLNIISSLLLVTLSAIYLVLYVTGKVDGSEAFALLSDEAKEAFNAHVHLGTYIIYSSILLIVFKVMALLFKKPAIKALYLIVILAFIGVNFIQGKSGGELVYVHGMNVKAVLDATNEVDDLQENLEELNEELTSLQKKISTLKSEQTKQKEQLKCKEVQESIDVIMQEDAKNVSEEEAPKEVVEESTQEEVAESNATLLVDTNVTDENNTTVKE